MRCIVIIWTVVKCIVIDEGEGTVVRCIVIEEGEGTVVRCIVIEFSLRKVKGLS